MHGGTSLDLSRQPASVGRFLRFGAKQHLTLIGVGRENGEVWEEFVSRGQMRIFFALATS